MNLHKEINEGYIALSQFQDADYSRESISLAEIVSKIESKEVALSPGKYLIDGVLYLFDGNFQEVDSLGIFQSSPNDEYSPRNY